MPVPMLLQVMSSEDIAECMAFEKLKDPKYREHLQLSMMSEEQQELKFMQMLGFKNGDNR